MDKRKKFYEISVWEDRHTTGVTSDGRTIGYYEEVQLAIIGGSEVTSLYRVLDPKLTQNVNGTETLEFYLHNRFINEKTGEKEANPIVKFLINERKIKLHYNNEWYDFVIKRVEPSSKSSIIKYSTKSLYTNELGKTGFELEFETDLENNQGTVIELAEKVLENTDWAVNKDLSETVVQENSEPLYSILLKESITGIDMKNSGAEITIPAGETIYGFYTPIAQENKYFQFFYREDEDYTVDPDNNINNSLNLYRDNTTYTDRKPSFATSMEVSEYRGKRLVRTQFTKYDESIDKYIRVYEDSEGREVYGYVESEYTSPTIIQNYITNAKDYPATDGWNISKNGQLDYMIYPPISTVVDFNTTVFTPFLRAKVVANSTRIYNSVFKDSISSIYNITKGEKFVFRINHKTSTNADKNLIRPSNANALKAIVAEFTLNDGVYTLGKKYFEYNTLSLDAENYHYAIDAAKDSLSYKDLITKKIGFFLYSSTTSQYYFLEDVQFFRYKEDSNGKMLVPGSIPDGIIKTIYHYYSPGQEISSIDDLIYLYKGETPSASYEEKYDPTFEKIRDIKISKSNRFNILQTIAETFGCWIKFTIEHDPITGKILLDKDLKQKKYISFHNFLGKENFGGFKYGINLKTIVRNLTSDELSNKVIVLNNSNQFAKNGFCTIARAEDNTIKENFLLNFDYYINMGLLDYSTVMNDLYMETDRYLGYYYNLEKINKDRDAQIEELSFVLNEITKITAQENTYRLAVESAETNLLVLYNEIKYYSGYTYEQLKAQSTQDVKNKLKDQEVINILTKIETLKVASKNQKILQTQATENLKTFNTKKDKLEKNLEEMAERKDLLHKAFYKKYSKFIQEGNWQSEDYIDDNLYFLDANDVARTAAFPRVSYNIDVIEISAVEGFENYNFQVGEKTYIEDTEYFGWITINGMKTPYQEEILITETIISLDSPEDNRIRVQNYQTGYENLFQGLVQTTQNLQFKSTVYNKAANIVDENGFIKSQTLQEAFRNNSFVLSNARDQSVIWDDRGIITTSLLRPNEITRITSGGIFMSNDGGETWSIGLIPGTGINTNLLTAGQIDVNRISIMNGNYPSFRWDYTGINAYQVTEDLDGQPYFNFGRFVRYDQFGLYGVNRGDSFIPKTEEEIREVADFAVTWSGFLLRSNHTEDSHADDGYILIDSKEDFLVVDGNGKRRIKIGKLDTSLYGIRFFNDLEEIVLESETDGNLKLSGRISIGTDIYNPRAELGVIESFEPEGGKPYSKIFSVKDTEEIESIAFYDDGTLFARNADITGRITATEGSFTGNIYANNGYFRGHVEALSGHFENEFLVGPDGTITINAEDEEEYTTVAFLPMTEDILYHYTIEEEKYYKWVDDKLIEESIESLESYFGKTSEEIRKIALLYELSVGLPQIPSPDILYILNTEEGYIAYQWENSDWVVAKTFDENNEEDNIILKIVTSVHDMVKLPEEDSIYVLNDDISIYKFVRNFDGTYQYLKQEPHDYTWFKRRIFTKNNNFILYDDGTLIARQANLSGMITAYGGQFLGKLTVGTSENAGIDGREEADLMIWAGTSLIPENSVFRLYKDGSLYTSDIHLTGEAYVNEYIYLGKPRNSVYRSGLAGIDGENPLRAWFGAEELYEDATLRIYDDGSIFAKQLYLTGNLESENAFFRGNLQIGDFITIVHDDESKIGFIGTTNFLDNAYGWRIDQSGNAWFNNAYIRGKLQTAIFEYKKISAVGGNLYLAPSIYLIDNTLEVSEETENTNELIVVREEITGEILEIILKFVQPFSSIEESELWREKDDILVGGIILRSPEGVQQSVQFNWRGIIESLVIKEEDNIFGEFKVKIKKPVRGQLEILEGLSKDIESELTFEEIISLEEITLGKGTAIVNLGNENKANIYLSAGNPAGPYVQLQRRVQNGEEVFKGITRIGSLENVEDSLFGTLEGDGLYTQNAFIRGKLYLPNTGLTDETNLLNPDSSIRIWAGTTADNKENAPFIVRQDGSMHAKKGIFEGIVIASEGQFSGTIKTAGVVIEKEEDPETPERAEFYVAYKENPESYDDYVIKISKNGLEIWEQGLSVYSDYAAGWIDGVKTNHINHFYYGGAEQKPFPYFTVSDVGMRTTHKGIFQVDFENPISEGTEKYVSPFTAVKIEKGKILFSEGRVDTLNSDSFEKMQNMAYNILGESSIFCEENGMVLSSNRILIKEKTPLYLNVKENRTYNEINDENAVNIVGTLKVLGEYHNIGGEIQVGDLRIIEKKSGDKTLGIDIMF